MKETPDNQSANQTHKAGTEKTVTPSECADNGSDDDKGHCLTDIMAGTPEAIERATLLVGKPAGQTDRTGSLAPRLKPTADTPKYGKQDEKLVQSPNKGSPMRSPTDRLT